MLFLLEWYLLADTLPLLLEGSVGKAEEESLEIVVASDQDERVQGEQITLRDLSIPRQQLLTEMMAQSGLLRLYVFSIA